MSIAIPHRVRRLAVPVAAFALVAVGSAIALPDGEGTTDAGSRSPTVVATDSVAAGAPVDEVLRHVEVRQIESSSRAEGAFSSVEQIPDGVLVAALVPGQQVLASSVSENRVTAVGDGYVSVSVRLDSQRWVGPVTSTGSTVNVYAINAGVATLVSPGAVVLDSPDAAGVEPRDDAIVSLAVRADTLTAVLVAATEDKLWLTGR